MVKTAAIQLDIDAHEEIYYDAEEGLQGQGEFDQVNRILVAIRDSNQLVHGHGSPVYTSEIV